MYVHIYRAAVAEEKEEASAVKRPQDGNCISCNINIVNNQYVVSEEAFYFVHMESAILAKNASF